MTEKRKNRAHGAGIDAPPEAVALQSPAPPAAGAARNARLSSGAAATSSLGGVATFIKLVFGVVFAVGTALGVAWALVRYATTTKRFALSAIEVVGARRIDQREIGKLIGVELGTNVFSVDPSDAERRLLTNPWLYNVKVTRRLPGTLRVEVEERDAVAVAAIGERLYLVTKSGEPFKEVEPNDPWDLPVITGLSLENLARDRARELERIATGLEVLRHWERIPDSLAHPAEEVSLGDGADIVLTVGKNGIALHLGSGPWRQKLLMAARVIALVGQKGKLPGIVFLDNQAHPERVVVRMR